MAILVTVALKFGTHKTKDEIYLIKPVFACLRFQLRQATSGSLRSKLFFSINLFLIPINRPCQTKLPTGAKTGWGGRDRTSGMPVPKTGALPLGYAPKQNSTIRRLKRSFFTLEFLLLEFLPMGFLLLVQQPYCTPQQLNLQYFYAFQNLKDVQCL